MNRNQSTPFWVWIIVGLFVLAIFKAAAIVVGVLMMIFKAFASMSPHQKKEMMERAHLAHKLHEINSKKKYKHK